MLRAVFAQLRSAAPRRVQDGLTSFGLRLRAGLYGVGDGTGEVEVPVVDGRVLPCTPLGVCCVECCGDVVVVGCVAVVLDPCC